jgi:hypothetical protein
MNRYLWGFKKMCINRFGLHVNSGCIEAIEIKINYILCIFKYIQQFPKPDVMGIRSIFEGKICILSDTHVHPIMHSFKALLAKVSLIICKFMSGFKPVAS